MNALYLAATDVCRQFEFRSGRLPLPHVAQEIVASVETIVSQAKSPKLEDPDLTPIEDLLNELTPLEDLLNVVLLAAAGARRRYPALPPEFITKLLVQVLEELRTRGYVEPLEPAEVTAR